MYPSSSTQAEVTHYREDCAERNGEFKTCGPLTQRRYNSFAAAVCSFTCELPFRSRLASLVKKTATYDTNLTSTQTLQRLADELSNNDTSAFLKRFRQSESNYEALTELTEEQRGEFAEALDRALLSDSERDDLHIFLVPYIETDGSEIELEMTLAKNDNGDWIIISW